MGRFVNSIESMEAKYVDKTTGCWVWTGAIGKNGYGNVMVGYKNTLPHRFFYASYKGAIPTGLQLDHLCRNKLCVNPAHLEPVTARENTLRSGGLAYQNSQKKECLRGHALEGDNIYVTPDGRRNCKACRRKVGR